MSSRERMALLRWRRLARGICVGCYAILATCLGTPRVECGEVLVDGEASGAEPGDYSSFADAFADTLNQTTRQLTRPAADWLVVELGLDWPIHRGVGNLGGSEVCAYPSRNSAFCVLVGAKYGEWGQVGVSDYCLADATGQLRWVTRGQIVAPPCVSDTGIAATSSRAEPDSGWQQPGIRVDFIDLECQVVHHRTWTRRVRRPLQRSYPELYQFLPGSGLFITTMNVSDNPHLHAGEFNSTSLFVIDPFGTDERAFDLADSWPGSVDLEEAHPRRDRPFIDARVLRLRGQWRAVLSVGPGSPPTEEGYYELDLRDWTLRKEVTRTIVWD